MRAHLTSPAESPASEQSLGKAHESEGCSFDESKWLAIGSIIDRDQTPGCFHVQGRYEILRPKRTSLSHMVTANDGFTSFLGSLLSIDPRQRPTAEEALAHPWLLENLSA